MAEKLIWTELRRALASRAGVSEKKASAFLNAFNAQIVEALRSDKQVKINGLGTFRLQAVAPRKSVNVTTGEAITIEGYNKIAFTPEIGIKEMVGKAGNGEPLPVNGEREVIDPLKKLGAQADEIVDILGELGQSPKEEKKKEEKKPAKRKKVTNEGVNELTNEGVNELTNEGVNELTNEEPPRSESTGTEHQEEINEPEPIVETPKEEKPKEEKPKKRYHFMRDTLICVVILLMLLLAGYFFLREHLSGWIETLVQPQPAQTEIVTNEGVNELTNEGVNELADEETLHSESTDTEIQEEESYPELITIEPMHEASRLAWMAKRYYGNKIYWPYLYDANKDHISNPSQIAVGTPIRVPRLTAAQRDTTSVRFRKLYEEAYSKVKSGEWRVKSEE